MSLKTLVFSLLLLQALSQVHAQHEKVEYRPYEAPRGYRNETFLKAAHALGFLKLVDREPSVPAQVEVWKDRVYKQVDTTSLMLDVYSLKELEKPAPVLIFIHGGTWRSGKRSDYLPYLIDFALKGYVTATVSYSLSGVAKFPSAVEDVKCAIHWIREHAEEFGIDPEKVALIGGSAGGHLAMMAAYSGSGEFTRECTPGEHSSQVRAVVNLYGPSDLTTEIAQNHSGVIQFLGKEYREAPGLYTLASPHTHISKDDPPTLIFHGTIDDVVPVSQSDSLQQWLTGAGVPNEYHRLKGWPHTMDLSTKVNAYCQYYMDVFFKRWLF
ncbi:MAG: alpha/beta hydrolase [Bacteroidota bacterium]